jgi:hypothetical protein
MARLKVVVAAPHGLSSGSWGYVVVGLDQHNTFLSVLPDGTLLHGQSKFTNTLPTTLAVSLIVDRLLDDQLVLDELESFCEGRMITCWMASRQTTRKSCNSSGGRAPTPGRVRAATEPGVLSSILRVFIGFFSSVVESALIAGFDARTSTQHGA